MPYCTTEPFVSGFLSAVASSYLYDSSQKMDETGVEQLETRSQAKSNNLQDKYISEIQAKLESLDSHALQSLETPAANFIGLS